MGDLEPKVNVTAAVVRIAGKTALGAFGPVGTLVQSVIEEVMPLVRAKRIEGFAEELGDRLQDVPGDVLNLRVREPARYDLLENGLWQAARASSRERLSCIASVVANGLKAEDANEIDRRYLLKLLAEINDVEVLLLKLYHLAHYGDSTLFFEKHRVTLDQDPPTFGDGDVLKREKYAVRTSYEAHLVRLELFVTRYSPTRGKSPEFDSHGKLKSTRVEISQLGTLLLKEIGLTDG